MRRHKRKLSISLKSARRISILKEVRIPKQSEEVKEPSKNDLGYSAGFFDGEGEVSIAVQKASGHYFLTAKIGNGHLGVLCYLQKLWGGKIAWVETTTAGNYHWRLTIPPKKAERLFEKVSPYLIIKKKEAQTALEFRSTFVTGNPRPGRRLNRHLLKKRMAFVAKFKKIKGNYKVSIS